MTLFRLGLVQVGAKVIGGDGGRGRRHQGRVRALGRGPRAVAVGAICQPVRQHHPEPVLVVQGHTLQEVVQQLRGHRGVDAGTGGHERVNVVHALDVAGGEALAGLPGHGIHFWGETDKHHG